MIKSGESSRNRGWVRRGNGSAVGNRLFRLRRGHQGDDLTATAQLSAGGNTGGLLSDSAREAVARREVTSHLTAWKARTGRAFVVSKNACADLAAIGISEGAVFITGAIAISKIFKAAVIGGDAIIILGKASRVAPAVGVIVGLVADDLFLFLFGLVGAIDV